MASGSCHFACQTRNPLRAWVKRIEVPRFLGVALLWKTCASSVGGVGPLVKFSLAARLVFGENPPSSWDVQYSNWHPCRRRDANLGQRKDRYGVNPETDCGLRNISRSSFSTTFPHLWKLVTTIFSLIWSSAGFIWGAPE